MNKVNKTVTSLIILLMGINIPVNAENESNKVSYSPEDWPTRWSSAIRQQKTAKFPSRKNTQAPLTDLPEAVSDQDLFSSTQQRRGVSQEQRAYKDYRPYSRQQFSRKENLLGRDSAHAYQSNLRSNQGYYGASSYGYQNASSMTVMDPILGHPSLAGPMTPNFRMAPQFPMNMWPFGFMSFGGFPGAGVPYGYGGAPYGAGAYGYPMNNGGWNPQLRSW